MITVATLPDAVTVVAVTAVVTRHVVCRPFGGLKKPSLPRVNNLFYVGGLTDTRTLECALLDYSLTPVSSTLR